MARTFKEEDFAAKRNEILDIAQRLFYTRGYENVSIQDLLNELGISKGAFYHYFDSKPALLEAMIERMRDQAEALILPIVNDPDLPALAKLQRMFDAANRWKVARKDVVFAFVHVWYMDENALVRQKTTASMNRRMAQWLAEIIRQGVAQGVMTADNHQHLAEVVLTLIVGLGDAVAGALLALLASPTPAQRKDCLRDMQAATAAYTEAIERVLGAQAGSIELFSAKWMRAWAALPSTSAGGKSS